MAKSSNDNETARGPLADENGRAALLLVESLIHGLIAKSALTIADAVEIIDEAALVSRQIAEEATVGPPRVLVSATLLEAMSRSLSRDLPRK